MVCLTCPEHRPDNVYSYDEPDELQGRYDPLTKSYSYIKPPKHLNYMDNAGVEQTSLFFTIPGEVRNKIYDLALPDEREYEVIFLGSKGDGTLTHWKYLDKPPNFKWHRGVLLRGLQNRVKEEQSAKIFVKTVWSDPAYAVRRRREMRAGFRLFHAPNSLLDPVKGPAALLRVSRQIHYEAAQIFYARVILSFGSHNLLCQFEARLTGVAKLSLTHLALFYEQYAHSKKMDSKVWRDKSDAAFEEKIQMIAREFPNLQALRLTILLHDNPCGFNADGFDTNAAWAQPLKILNALHHLRSLDLDIRMEVWTNRNNDRVRLAAEKIKQHVLGERYCSTALRESETRLGINVPPARKPLPKALEMTEKEVRRTAALRRERAEKCGLV